MIYGISVKSMVRTWPTLPVCRPLLSREGWAWGGGVCISKIGFALKTPTHGMEEPYFKRESRLGEAKARIDLFLDFIL